MTTEQTAPGFFDYPTIQRYAARLAADLIALWHSRGADVPPAFAAADRLAALLEPGVAAFIGRLLTLAPDQTDAMPAVIDRFFADPATAAAFDSFASLAEEADDKLSDLILAAGLESNWALQYYFYEIAAVLFAAVVAALDHLSPEERPISAADRPPALITLLHGLDQGVPLPENVDIPFRRYYAYLVPGQIKKFVDDFLAGGMDRVEPAGIIAADGASVLLGWQPWEITGSAPPDEMTDSAGPDEAAAEDPPPDVTESISGGSGGSVPKNGSGTGEQFPADGKGPGDSAVDLRLDAALPERVTVGRAFDLAVAVMRLESPPSVIDDLQRRESAAFAAVWPADAKFIQLRIQIAAPDCLIHNGDSRPVRLLAGHDGPPVYFQITPQRPGPLSIIITVYQEMDWVGSARLRTEATTVEPRGGLAVVVSAQPVGDAEVNQTTLWKALDDGYNDSELRDLCFELAIDYEDLPVDNQSAKARARELVLFAKRRDLLAKLVECVMRDRPHLLAN